MSEDSDRPYLTPTESESMVDGESEKPRWSGFHGERLVMNRQNFQRAADTVVGSILETLESYNLPESTINTVRRIAWSEIDKQFGRFVDE